MVVLTRLTEEKETVLVNGKFKHEHTVCCFSCPQGQMINFSLFFLLFVGIKKKGY